MPDLDVNGMAGSGAVGGVPAAFRTSPRRVLHVYN